jgi:hypothetical protein
MRKYLLRALLTGLFAPVAFTGLSRADGPDLLVPQPDVPVYVHEAIPEAATMPVPPPASHVPGPTSRLAPEDRIPYHPITNFTHNCKYYCWSHHNNVGCGSLKAECKFIFGSCHEFYGEPCFKGPPPPPAPPGSNYPSGANYGYGPAAGCGCP